jgi:uncharacterized protein
MHTKEVWHMFIKHHIPLPLIWLLTPLLACILVWQATSSKAASFDCAKTSVPAEIFVCNNKELSKYDEELETLYRSVLSKANEEQKQALVAQQEHWLTHTLNVCEQEVCFKHAYWSRHSELATFFEPKLPLYAKESEKAEIIQKILTTEPLYGGWPDLPNRPICNEVFTALQQMQDIQFVDPVVQATSYEDPALDTWKEQVCAVSPCKKSPLTYAPVCEPRDELSPEEECGDTKETLGLCRPDYLIPPYKIFSILPSKANGRTRYFFHSNYSYCPLNERYRGLTSGRFYEFQIAPQCDKSARFVGPFDEHKLIDFQIMAEGINYNSVIIHNQLYFLVVLEHDDDSESYWLKIQPMDGLDGCNWFPIK